MNIHFKWTNKQLDFPDLPKIFELRFDVEGQYIPEYQVLNRDIQPLSAEFNWTFLKLTFIHHAPVKPSTPKSTVQEYTSFLQKELSNRESTLYDEVLQACTEQYMS